MVERVDTHGASVFLAGDRAIKLKRAVALGFLDFRSLEARARACRAELELNRRTAPDLYLGLRWITRDADGGLAFDGAGQPVDIVVVMRRFASDARLDRLIARDTVAPAELRELAIAIARFHDAAAVVETPDAARRLQHILDNLHDALARHIAGDDRLAVWRDRLAAAIEAETSLIDQRGRDGAIRRGHGDLHLANICRFQGQLVIFDALEFDDELATIDTLYDLAFLLVDLLRLGRRDHANLVCNTYLDERPEPPDALRLLAPFMALRAGVRALAALLSSARDGAASAASSGLWLDLAIQVLAPSTARLLAIGGRSGTGKSHLAARIAPDLGGPIGARVLRSDVLRKQACKVPLNERLPEPAYAPGVTARIYRALARDARTILAAGGAVIADAVFLQADERALIAKAAGGARFDGVWLDAPIETRLARIGSRRNDASDAGDAVARAQEERDAGVIGWHRIEAGEPGESAAQQVIRLVNTTSCHARHR